MGFGINIPLMKMELPQGNHDCIITDIYVLTNNGKVVYELGDYVVILSLKRGDKITQKSFKMANKYDKDQFKKLWAIFGLHPGKRSDLINKHIKVKIIEHEGELVIKNFKPVK